MTTGKATYFISDTHLGASYLKDGGKEAERKVVQWLDAVKHDAAAIYLLGDILDYWYEYKYVVPKGFVRFFGKLAELADSGVKIYWFAGNHDIWLYDYFPHELGIEIVDGVKEVDIDGKSFLLAHGDGVGYVPPGFRFIRSLFRNRFCQRLYSAINPRWTIPFALGWSGSSRKAGAGESAEAELAVVKLSEFAVKFNETHHIDYFIFGHIHTPVVRSIAADSTLIVLGDWISSPTIARFCNGEMSVTNA